MKKKKRIKKNIKLIISIIILIIIGITLLIIFNNKKEDNKPTKKKEIDNIKPTITIIKDVLKIDGDTSLDLVSNTKSEFGPSGGKTECVPEELKVGENIITCKAIGNNKLTAEVSYKIIMSKTYQKNAIFFGDSIVYGYASRPVGRSWANYIGDNYDLNVSTNAGITDYRVSTYDDPKKWLVDEVKSHYDDKNNYDFIILEGGVNDVLYDTPIGQISNSKELNSFNPKTFCGGLETYLYYVTSKWKNARIGYIITYYTPNYTERGLKWSYSDYKKYYDITIKILDKWNIKYLNFATEEYNEIFKVETRTYLPDYLHLNNEGYKKISPYIYNFMQTLDKYTQ